MTLRFVGLLSLSGKANTPDHFNQIHQMITTIDTILEAIQDIKGTKFVGFIYKAKSTGEVARHVLIVGASYLDLTQRSITQLQDMLPSLSGLELEGANLLLASYQETLDNALTGKAHSAYTKKGIYAPAYARGEVVKGVSRHVFDMSLEISGLAHSKTVLVAGVYPTVNSRPLTIAKGKVEAMLPRAKFRTLCLDEDALLSIRISGNILDMA